MSDLISRQAALDALKVAYWDNDIQSAKDDPCIVDAMTDWAIRQIKALPSAERRGRWLKGDEMADYPRIPYKAWETYCSCCGEIKEQINDNFCGNCGARMDEVIE